MNLDDGRTYFNKTGGNPYDIDKKTILVDTGDVTPKPNMAVSNQKNEKIQKKVLPRSKL